MGRLRVLVLILAIPLSLLGCKKEVPITGTPLSGKNIVIEADDGEEHKAVYKEDSSYYMYDYNTGEKTLTDVGKNLETAYSVEPVPYKGDVGDNLTPDELDKKNVLISPNTYRCNTDTSVGEYLGYLQKAGYTTTQVFRCETYNDFLLTHLTKNIRVIAYKDRVKIFFNSDKKEYTIDTYINEKKE